MNRKEIINILSIATANFPNMQERDLKPTAILWEKSLTDIPYDIAEKALIKVLSTSRFFPTIAELRDACSQLTNPRRLDAMEAWGLIVDAIRKYGYYQERAAMESLPPDVVTLVKQFTWRDLCLSETPEILRAQFRNAWDIQLKRNQEMDKLPQEIREMIEGTSRSVKLLGD